MTVLVSLTVAQGGLERDVAAAVDGLGNEQDGAAILKGLLFEQADGQDERVQGGGTAVAGLDFGERLFCACRAMEVKG